MKFIVNASVLLSFASLVLNFNIQAQKITKGTITIPLSGTACKDQNHGIQDTVNINWTAKSKDELMARYKMIKVKMGDAESDLNAKIKIEGALIKGKSGIFTFTTTINRKSLELKDKDNMIKLLYSFDTNKCEVQLNFATTKPKEEVDTNSKRIDFLGTDNKDETIPVESSFDILWIAKSEQDLINSYKKIEVSKNGNLSKLDDKIKITQNLIKKETDNVYMFKSEISKNTLSLIDADNTITLYYFDEKGKKVELVLNFEQKLEAQSPQEIVQTNFITPEMVKSLTQNNCDNCNRSAPIANKKHSQFNTDYFIVYDPSKGASDDVYTICKHVYTKMKKIKKLEPYKNLYQNNNEKTLERYRKVRPRWFAPKVGSSITFEVQNLPLATQFQLSVNEKDLFNDGAAKFESIITGLVAKQIVPASKADTATDGEHVEFDTKNAKNTIDALNALAEELNSYLQAFRISSCAINAHRQNLPQILASINSVFGTKIIGTSDMESKLKAVIAGKAIEEPEKTKAIELAGQIAIGFASLATVNQPIAYSTIRAKNMDYIEVKYKEGNKPESKPENIRMSGGMKIDFSAGFVLTGMRDYNYVLKDIVYNYDPDDSTLSGGGSNGPLNKRDTTGNVITQQDNGKQEVGVAILSHFYPRISSHYNLGGAVGLMTSTDMNLRLMLGGSFIVSSLFGSNNRISFTYGVVWGKVKRLGVENQEFLDKPRIVNSIPSFYAQPAPPTPVDKNTSSWFFSVNFNFGGK